MSAAKLIARCLAVRTTTHIDHLLATSYAHHQALGTFYEDLVDAVDEYAESYMGVFGKLAAKDFPTVRLSPGDPVATLGDLREWIVTHRAECCAPAVDEDSEDPPQGDATDATDLASLLDNILIVIDRALYKLKFLG